VGRRRKNGDMNEKQEQEEEQMASGSSRPLLDRELNVFNIGLDVFYNALKFQDINVMNVTWSPPTKLDMETDSILDKML
jgi:hypothetical protein